MTEMFKFSDCCNNLRRTVRSLGSSEQLESRMCLLTFLKSWEISRKSSCKSCVCVFVVHPCFWPEDAASKKESQKNIKSSICVGTSSSND